MTGAITVSGAGPVAVAASTIRGPVTLLSNRGATVVAGNTVHGPITCAGNQPAPVHNGLRNTGSGARLGQCAKL